MGPGPVGYAAARASGVTAGQLRAAIDAGVVMRVRRGIVIDTASWAAGSSGDRRRWALEAALQAFPGSFGSHETAARLHRLPDYRMDPPTDPPSTHITVTGAARREGWLTVHGCDTPRIHVSEVDELAVTDLVRTSIEVAATRSLRSAVVFVDAAMRREVGLTVGGWGLREAVLEPDRRLALRQQWRVALRPYARHRWVTRVREAVEMADPGSESVLESLSRVAVVEWGLPVPRCGVPVQGDDGRTYWADMVWDDARVIGEADGLSKYDGVEAVLAEKRRQEALEGRGWTFARWGMAEVLPDSSVMAARIRRAFDLSRRPQMSRNRDLGPGFTTFGVASAG